MRVHCRHAEPELHACTCDRAQLSQNTALDLCIMLPRARDVAGQSYIRLHARDLIRHTVVLRSLVCVAAFAQVVQWFDGETRQNQDKDEQRKNVTDIVATRAQTNDANESATPQKKHATGAMYVHELVWRVIILCSFPNCS